jgi:hypothetical protein
MDHDRTCEQERRMRTIGWVLYIHDGIGDDDPKVGAFVREAHLVPPAADGIPAHREQAASLASPVAHWTGRPVRVVEVEQGRYRSRVLDRGPWVGVVGAAYQVEIAPWLAVLLARRGFPRYSDWWRAHREQRCAFIHHTPCERGKDGFCVGCGWPMLRNGSEYRDPYPVRPRR